MFFVDVVVFFLFRNGGRAAIEDAGYGGLFGVVCPGGARGEEELEGVRARGGLGSGN